jgi:hypothetical protein
LHRLEAQARELRRSGQDRKWTELDAILDHPLMTDTAGNRRKLIVFTEPRDTLAYLADKIRTRLGRHEAVVEIHGGIGREDRRKAVEAFTHDKRVLVMVANDAAGEGINLQRAHLMVNYDLPWNPNRLEQRFGRIHRIGQTEVCHLWNLVAKNTREGEVYARLLEKLEAARHALGGRVYDVLGRLFQGMELRDLLVEAIRYGEQPEVKARLFEKLDAAVDQQRLLDLLAERALVRDHLTVAQVAEIRDAMERAEARRLQPHYVESFFLEAFRHLGGQMHRRESGRWEITRVPGAIRERDRQIGRMEPVWERYERVCFEKDRADGPPVAAYLCPGHPLLDATLDLVLERHRDLMKRGAVLVDDADDGEDIRALFYLEHAVQDGRIGRGGHQLVVSQRLQFVEIDGSGAVRDGGAAPYLDYRPIRPEERATAADRLAAGWLTQNLESRVMAHAVTRLVPGHVEEVRARRLPEIAKVEAEVQARLKREIIYWDNRAEDLRAQERAGRPAGRLNAGQAAARAQDLADRLERRLAELARERDITALPPVVLGGALVVPAGLLRQLGAPAVAGPAGFAETSAEARAAVEHAAMNAVIAAERALGFEPLDVSQQNRGYDIESRDPLSGHLRFIEVKGRRAEAREVMVTRNEILASLNTPDAFILALVSVDNGFAREPVYVQRFAQRELGFAQTAVAFDLDKLLSIGRRSSQTAGPRPA